MGAKQFDMVEFGKTPLDAFKRAKEVAFYDHGHSGYTGTIAEKDTYKVISKPKDKDVDTFIEELFNNSDPRIDDRWGPAGCIEVTDEVKKDHKERGSPYPRGKRAFRFFGWARC